MKKLVSFLVLLIFVGSLLIMTGCFGGSDDGDDDYSGSGAAEFTLAISASGGTGAAAFAANTRNSIRPAINLASATEMIVYPLNADGTKASTTGYRITRDQITFKDGVTKEFYKELKIQDSYNQYLVEVYNSGFLITQSIQYVPTAKKTGATAILPVEVNASSTAQVFIYNNWQKTATRRSYNDFKYNLNKATIQATINMTPIETETQTQLNSWANSSRTAAPTYNAVVYEAPAALVSSTQVSTVSGYVKQIDGAGSSNAWVYLASGTTTIDHDQAESGYYIIEQVPNGTYTVTPSLLYHSFTPPNYTITVNGADVANLNFQAAAAAGSIR